MVVEGIKTNIPLHRELMVDAASSKAAPTSTTWNTSWPTCRTWAKLKCGQQAQKMSWTEIVIEVARDTRKHCPTR
jgi:hypothetical protein